MPLVFLHSHLLDFNQPKTNVLSFIENLLWVFINVRPSSFGLVLSMLYYKWGKRWLYNLHWAVLLILNFDINIKNKLINLFLFCLDDFVDVL